MNMQKLVRMGFYLCVLFVCNVLFRNTFHYLFFYMQLPIPHPSDFQQAGV